MRLALYLRISNDPYGNSDAPERQALACREYADRLGHTIVETYEDRDLSAYKKSVVRPGFLSMLAAGVAGSFEGILAWRTERLFRNFNDYVKWDDTKLAFLCEDGYDSRVDTVILPIKVAIARDEVRKLTERVVNKYKFLASKGEPHAGGRRPYGYTHSRKIVHDEAALIVEAATQILNGTTLSAITRTWNAGGVGTASGGIWDATRLARTLRRHDIGGYRSYHGDLIPGTWEPILSRDQYERVQLLLGDPSRRTGPRPPRRWSASGLVRCGICSAVMRVNRVNKKPTYCCTGCGRVGRSAHMVEGFVRGALADFVDQVDHDAPSGNAILDNSLNELRAAQGRFDKLTRDHYVDGIIDATTFKTMARALTERLDVLRSEVAANSRSQTLSKLPGTGEAFLEMWDQQDASANSVTARSMIAAVYVHPVGRGIKKPVAGSIVVDWLDAAKQLPVASQNQQ